MPATLNPLVPLGPAGRDSVQGLALPDWLVCDYQRNGVFAVLGERTFTAGAQQARLLDRSVHPRQLSPRYSLVPPENGNTTSPRPLNTPAKSAPTSGCASYLLRFAKALKAYGFALRSAHRPLRLGSFQNSSFSRALTCFRGAKRARRTYASLAGIYAVSVTLYTQKGSSIH